MYDVLNFAEKRTWHFLFVNCEIRMASIAIFHSNLFQINIKILLCPISEGDEENDNEEGDGESSEKKKRKRKKKKKGESITIMLHRAQTLWIRSCH